MKATPSGCMARNMKSGWLNEKRDWEVGLIWHYAEYETQYHVNALFEIASHKLKIPRH